MLSSVLFGGLIAKGLGVIAGIFGFGVIVGVVLTSLLVGRFRRKR
jgi:hypothetical protein